MFFLSRHLTILYTIIHFHLWSLISTFVSPTPAATNPAPAITLDPAIWAALIGLVTPYSLICELAAKDLAALGDNTVNQRLLLMLPDKQIDLDVRKGIAKSLGQPENRSIVPDLLGMLVDKRIDWTVRANIVMALGKLGDRSIVPDLLGMLADKQLDTGIRESIVMALDKLLMFPDKYDEIVHRSIADTLGKLGDHTIVPELLNMLLNEQVEASVRGSIADALGELEDHTIIPELLHILADSQINKRVRCNITGALEKLMQGENDVSALAVLLPSSDIANEVHRALWTISRRVGVRIYMIDGAQGKQAKIVKW